MFKSKRCRYRTKYQSLIVVQEHIILPKLPVPDLQETLKQYLLVVKPLTSERNFENTKTLVEEFGRRGGVGEQLQKKLIERHAQRENWVIFIFFKKSFAKELFKSQQNWLAISQL